MLPLPLVRWLLPWLRVLPVHRNTTTGRPERPTKAAPVPTVGDDRVDRYLREPLARAAAALLSFAAPPPPLRTTSAGVASTSSSVASLAAAMPMPTSLPTAGL